MVKNSDVPLGNSDHIFAKSNTGKYVPLALLIDDTRIKGVKTGSAIDLLTSSHCELTETVQTNLTIIDKSVNIIVTSGGTDGRIRCSDWPTNPPVMDACLLIRSLGTNPSLEPTQTKGK